MIQGTAGAVDATPATAALEGQDAIDRLRRFGGDRLAREMIALFADSVPERFAAARTALVAADTETLVRTMHGLKSSSAQLGGTGAARLCAEVEHAARAEQLFGLAPAIDRAEQAVHELVAWLVHALPPDSGVR
ncbi:Hpt domain-containing protein [Roseisolibacter agri]|uniref:HPt domain-containing protein n=1 Tax=Roseisolibacter agri TaxID=2014610 RepID=A0AA37VDH5_9BACT|nr:Hpt domain-containing protein [Roseisolibacter agri]GLC23684.1 hypothetical protein rosag_01970 [Roseisolibacter agri]